MKMFLDAELEEIMTTEFQRGFEACRAAAVKVCRTPLPTNFDQIRKTATECANEIARLQVPRFRGHPEKKTPCPQISDGIVCGRMRAGSERICPDCNPQRKK